MMIRKFKHIQTAIWGYQGTRVPDTLIEQTELGRDRTPSYLPLPHGHPASARSEASVHPNVQCNVPNRSRAYSSLTRAQRSVN